MRVKHGIAILLTLTMLLLCACSGAPKNSGAPTAQPTNEVQTEPTAAPADKLGEMIADMTLEEKVGQMFYVRCPDVGAADWIQTYHLGGLILFGRDFADKTAAEIKNNISTYQAASKIPLLIGVDEEGGTVVRVSDNQNLRSSAFPSPKEVFRNGGWGAVAQTETEKADLLLSLGINVNMAPVCDVTSNTESFMYDRSFSGDAQEVCTFVTTAVGICKQKRLGTVLKHFPGYGDNTDTHDDMSYDSKPYADFAATDFLPFQAGINAGADCVLVAHNIVASMDDKLPASLSEKVHRVLRDDLRFDGVVMTDDLVMQAITNYTGADAAAVAAAKCGNDILCCTDVETQYPAVLAAVQNGDISEEQINASVKRILQWKYNLGLIHFH